MGNPNEAEPFKLPSVGPSIISRLSCANPRLLHSGTSKETSAWSHIPRAPRTSECLIQAKERSCRERKLSEDFLFVLCFCLSAKQHYLFFFFVWFYVLEELRVASRVSAAPAPYCRHTWSSCETVQHTHRTDMYQQYEFKKTNLGFKCECVVDTPVFIHRHHLDEAPNSRPEVQEFSVSCPFLVFSPL